jgi:broad specificity phosphatase PhoE
MNIIAIRHAEAEHLVKDIIGGRNETTLTLSGEQQAIKTAKSIKEILKNSTPIIYCSDQTRAVQTAQAISQAYGVTPIFTSELRSIDNGIAKNMSPSEARQSASPLITPRIDWIPWPSSESWRMLYQRVANFMGQFRDSESDIIIVTHGKTLVSLVQWWMGYTEEQLESAFFDFDTDPCGITHLCYSAEGERYIRKLNSTIHLL